MKRTPVAGRWPGAGLAAVGLLLAAPAIFWPVLVITYGLPDDVPLDTSNSLPPLAQGIWGWGKYAQLGDVGPDMMFEMSNTMGLVIFAGSLTLGAGAVAAWALVAGEGGRSLGIAGIAVAVAVQLASSAQWVGQRQSVRGRQRVGPRRATGVGLAAAGVRGHAGGGARRHALETRVGVGAPGVADLRCGSANRGERGVSRRPAACAAESRGHA